MSQESIDIKLIKLTRRAYWGSRYSAVALKIETLQNCDGASKNQFKYLTKTGGQGEPYLQGNDIVFDVNASVYEIEIIWPKQTGVHHDNWAQISQLEIHVTSGRRLKFE